MFSTLGMIAWGLLFLIGIVHPRLGPYVYREAWPGFYTDARNKRLAVIQCSLLGIAWTLVGVIVLLQSFRNDTVTIISLFLLIPCALCAIIGIILGRRLQN